MVISIFCLSAIAVAPLGLPAGNGEPDGAVRLDLFLVERGLERDEIVDLRLHLREVAHADLPPTSISILRPASAPPSPCQLEEAGRARVLHQLRSAAIFSFIVRESGTVS